MGKFTSVVTALKPVATWALSNWPAISGVIVAVLMYLSTGDVKAAAASVGAGLLAYGGNSVSGAHAVVAEHFADKAS